MLASGHCLSYIHWICTNESRCDLPTLLWVLVTFFPIRSIALSLMCGVSFINTSPSVSPLCPTCLIFILLFICLWLLLLGRRWLLERYFCLEPLLAVILMDFANVWKVWQSIFCLSFPKTVRCGAQQDVLSTTAGTFLNASVPDGSLFVFQSQTPFSNEKCNLSYYRRWKTR